MAYTWFLFDADGTLFDYDKSEPVALANTFTQFGYTVIVISEEVGHSKPHPGIFDVAFARMGHPRKDQVLMIGDSLTSDIKGGCDYGIDTCWFNPAGAPRPTDMTITHEIRTLEALLPLAK